MISDKETSPAFAAFLVLSEASRRQGYDLKILAVGRSKNMQRIDFSKQVLTDRVVNKIENEGLHVRAFGTVDDVTYPTHPSLELTMVPDGTHVDRILRVWFEWE